MTIDDIIQQFAQTDQPQAEAFNEACATFGGSRSAFADYFSREVGRRYQDGALDYGTANCAINHLSAWCGLENLSQYSFAIYQAFDEGEYTHRGQTAGKPEDLYTRPLLREAMLAIFPVIAEFIEEYDATQRDKIAFAWNGKHAGEFIDTNQTFRWEVIQACIANPERGSVTLLEHLFLADADWAVQAWGAPHHFAQLGARLLERGGRGALESFSTGFSASFDTFGACHEMQLPATLLASLSDAVKAMLDQSVDQSLRVRLEGALTLFEKIGASTATAGWAKLAPGSPVSDVRIAWPRWYHKMWEWLSRKMQGS